MKYKNTLSWIVPALISFFMLFSAYISGTRVVEFAQLGFPEYFRIELTTAKVIGALLLLIPPVPARIKEWIYVGFGVVLISAAIAKFSSGYPMIGVLEPLIVFTIMAASLLYLNKLAKT
ncbi:MAG TPA: DoxX family protein [Chthoniobacterales bacterium]